TFAKQQPQQMVDTQAAPEALDRALKLITEFSGGGLQSQRFLTGLIGYIRTYHPEVAEQLTKQQEGGRIVLPGQFTPSPAPAEPPGHLHTGHQHTHDHTCRH
ncbi:MAG: hypothetical protein HZA21_02000, partial [Nitrospirae bacterium]|nr:hypothetical protein [Nitrospirota bacterium]